MGALSCVYTFIMYGQYTVSMYKTGILVFLFFIDTHSVSLFHLFSLTHAHTRSLFFYLHTHTPSLSLFLYLSISRSLSLSLSLSPTHQRGEGWRWKKDRGSLLQRSRNSRSSTEKLPKISVRPIKYLLNFERSPLPFVIYVCVSLETAT